MKDAYKSLIDSRNEDLWRTVNAHFKIILKDSQEANYMTNYSASGITILVNPDHKDPAPFTHEMLHLYMKYRQTYILRDMQQMTKEDHLLLHLFTSPVISHICNCLEHYKMLPMYLERGFDIKFFVEDFHQRLMEPEEMTTLKASYIKNGILDGKAVQTFIRKYFAMKSSCNQAYDYNPYYRELSEVDGQLFGILEKFWENWLSFKIGNPPQEYQTMLEDFLQEMREWIQGKTLVY